ncbi:MAG: adenine phosphoribosyltransferase [Ktedonobacterales bacterium]|nr:adenine phosphoribosyltransferase [Ktedonobacterales bacterium]
MSASAPIPADAEQRLRRVIRDVPDFPQPGILFRDITPLLGNAATLRLSIDLFAAAWRDHGIDYIVGIESRGFLFGMPLAYALGTGFVPVRKAGKLPHKTIGAEYTLEYGANTMEVHADAVQPGQRVLIVDDLLATGGTAAATVALLQRLGAEVIGLAFVIELAALGGRAQLGAIPTQVLITY